MENKNLEIIKAFLTEMATQDNRSTASPFFYVIRTKVEEVVPLDNCEKSQWYWQDNSYDSLEEIETQCREDGCSEEQIEKIGREACEYGVRYRWDKQGMFLTESDAKAHLAANHYHYSSDAHTYVEHAWRAPQLAKFVNALMDHFSIEDKPSDQKQKI